MFCKHMVALHIKLRINITNFFSIIDTVPRFGSRSNVAVVFINDNVEMGHNVRFLLNQTTNKSEKGIRAETYKNTELRMLYYHNNTQSIKDGSAEIGTSSIRDDRRRPKFGTA